MSRRRELRVSVMSESLAQTREATQNTDKPLFKYKTRRRAARCQRAVAWCRGKKLTRGSDTKKYQLAQELTQIQITLIFIVFSYLFPLFLTLLINLTGRQSNNARSAVITGILPALVPDAKRYGVLFQSVAKKRCSTPIY
jgi:hypothetical protein